MGILPYLADLYSIACWLHYTRKHILKFCASLIHTVQLVFFLQEDGRRIDGRDPRPVAPGQLGRRVRDRSILCMSIYIYIYMYIYMYTYIYIYMYTYIHE